MKNILEQYSKEICKNCKNIEHCEEELHIKIDRSVKCNKYEREKQNEYKSKHK